MRLHPLRRMTKVPVARNLVYCALPLPQRNHVPPSVPPNHLPRSPVQIQPTEITFIETNRSCLVSACHYHLVNTSLPHLPPCVHYPRRSNLKLNPHPSEQPTRIHSSPLPKDLMKKMNRTNNLNGRQGLRLPHTRTPAPHPSLVPSLDVRLHSPEEHRSTLQFPPPEIVFLPIRYLSSLRSLQVSCLPR